MSQLVRLCKREELPPAGQAREFTAADKPICVANVDGICTAMNNVCPHRGGPLAEGTIEGTKIICPWHAWEFDLLSGECGTTAGVKTDIYRIQLDGDDVLIEI